MNIVGNRGESEVATELLTPTDTSGSIPAFPFHPIFLGEKAPVFDFLVYLLDDSGQPTGAHFFVQTKTTRRALQADRCIARLPIKDVRAAQAFKCPSFIFAVHAPAKSARIYIAAIAHDRSRGIERIPVCHDLASDAVKIQLYSDVSRFFRHRTFTFNPER